MVMALFTTVAIAQEEEPLFLLFEFMHVDEGQGTAYLETEAFWEKVHVQRVKNGDCIGWDLWRLEPSGQKQGSQYMTVSLYNDPVKMMDGGASASGIKSKILMNKEDLESLKKHGIYSNTVLIWSKYLFKVFQMI